jgi:hypothetical protein
MIAAWAATIGIRRPRLWRALAFVLIGISAFVVDRVTPIPPAPAPQIAQPRQKDVEKEPSESLKTDDKVSAVKIPSVSPTPLPAPNPIGQVINQLRVPPQPRRLSQHPQL